MRYLKASTATRHQGKPLDICFEFIQKFLRQTDGCGQIASSRAIFNL